MKHKKFGSNAAQKKCSPPLQGRALIGEQMGDVTASFRLAVNQINKAFKKKYKFEIVL